jgi:hypothetical protein
MSKSTIDVVIVAFLGKLEKYQTDFHCSLPSSLISALIVSVARLHAEKKLSNFLPL